MRIEKSTGRKRQTDKEQLEYAIKHNRTILTRNIKHFINLQKERHNDGLSHNGLLVTDRQSAPNKSV